VALKANAERREQTTNDKEEFEQSATLCRNQKELLRLLIVLLQRAEIRKGEKVRLYMGIKSCGGEVETRRTSTSRERNQQSQSHLKHVAFAHW
jgi:hypothetical protein